MRSLAILPLVLSQAIALPSPAAAQSYYVARAVAVERWQEQWDEASQSWVRVDEPGATASDLGKQQGADADAPQYGPFRLLDGQHVALIGSTDANSPGEFKTLLLEHPGVEVLEFVDAAGTRDDIANLALGRMIRAAGIATHVPESGSVRSGAVELFMAGVERKIEDGAEFAVHSWVDTKGRGPGYFDADAPENRIYLDYYEEMGMSAERARAFYAMTNSVPYQFVLKLSASEMRVWIVPAPPAKRPKGDLAQLDLGHTFP